MTEPYTKNMSPWLVETIHELLSLHLHEAIACINDPEALYFPNTP